jgi:radical SAM superfamily enzyme YgiQ (UPF0313 family)
VDHGRGIFTTNKKRVIALCRRTRERNLGFFWSCDTRVDLLEDELLREMRLAGCQRLSLGVESGSQRILDAIDKKITPDEIVASTNRKKRRAGSGRPTSKEAERASATRSA